MKKCKNLFWIAAIPFLSGLASCSDELIKVTPEPEPQGPTIQVPLTFRTSEEIVLIDGELKKDLPNSRVVGDPLTSTEEADVDNIWIIQFNGDTDGAVMVGAPYYADTPASGVTKVPLVESTVNNRLVFVANTNTSNANIWGLTSGVSTYSDLKNKYLTLTGSDEPLSFGGVDKSLIMSATVVGIVDPTLSGILTGTPITFTRSVAKVQLNLTIDPTDAPNFRILSIQLKSVQRELDYLDNLKGLSLTGIYPLEANLTTIDYPVMRSELTSGADDFDADLSGTLVPGTNGTFTWFVPRNARGVASNASVSQKNAFAPQGATYIEIMAVTTTATGGEGVIYRVYPGANNTNDFNIIPNYKYIINLNIVGKGTTADTRIENMGEVIFDTSNSYILNPPIDGMPARRYKVPVQRVNDFWAGIGDTYGGEGPSAGLGSSASPQPWTVELLWQDAQHMVKAFGIGDPTQHIILEKATGSGPSDYFYITVPAGIPAGNFVVVLKKGAVTLWSWHFWVTDYNPVPGKINVKGDVWTYPVTGGQVERYGSVMFGYPHTGGNEDYTYNSTPTFSSAATAAPYAQSVMMDRNIGAISAAYNLNDRGSLYYQYGRKDPIPGKNQLYDINGTALPFSGGVAANGCIIAATALANGLPAIKEAIANPLTFYINANDWAGINNANYLWFDSQLLYSVASANGAGRFGKSIFDPCPQGWKLPLNGTWNDFRPSSDATVNDAGRDLAFLQGLFYWPYIKVGSVYPRGGRIFYPAAGYRPWDGAGFSNVGGIGYSRSATPNGTAGSFYLIFSSGSAGPSNSGDRSLGFSARCVSAFWRLCFCFENRKNMQASIFNNNNVSSI